VFDYIGGRSRIRTCDPLIKRQLLDEAACRASQSRAELKAEPGLWSRTGHH
jgi:hypothetical protein